MPEVGISGLIVILVVALLVFGPKRLPEIGRSVGKGLREFKDSVGGSQPSEAAAEADSLEASKEETGSSAAVRSESRFCTTCGAQAGSGDRFCVRCGASLADTPQALTR